MIKFWSFVHFLASLVAIIFILSAVKVAIAVTPSANVAPSAIIRGILTPIKSRIEGIIANRHQEHMWVTTDGGVHALAAGSEEMLNGWTLFSSHDQGFTWTNEYQITDTTDRPKTDGILSGDTLYIVYADAAQALYLLILSYDAPNKQWLDQGSHLLFQGDDVFTAERATINLDSNGQPWFAFSQMNHNTGESIIKIYYIDEQYNPIDTQTTLGTMNLSLKKSPRVLRTSDGVVVIYTDGPDDSSSAYTLNWAYRLNSWAFDDWFHEELYQLTEADGATDPYGAHFSAAVDSLDNIHIVMRSEHQVRYFRIEDYTLVTPIPQELGQASPYVQISVSTNDIIYVAYGAPYGIYKDLVWILQSNDHGQQFGLKDVLYYKPKQNLGYTRIEIPCIVGDWIPVMRQVERTDGFEGLVYFHLLGETH